MFLEANASFYYRIWLLHLTFSKEFRQYRLDRDYIPVGILLVSISKLSNRRKQVGLELENHLILQVLLLWWIPTFSIFLRSNGFNRHFIYDAVHQTPSNWTLYRAGSSQRMFLHGCAPIILSAFCANLPFDQAPLKLQSGLFFSKRLCKDSVPHCQIFIESLKSDWEGHSYITLFPWHT